ncbi:MAG TPA: type II toxin-antitoxin system VapC family toxin [Tepidisphaeraceae bacterium]|nr:type II toxin-antitoxin system VapC family toxin [Tepidisphaeraceae bacterium]
MPDRLLVDSDVLVDYTRQLPQAVQYVRGLRSRAVLSAVTVCELYAGVREGRERRALDALVASSNVVAADVQIAELAGLILRQYRPSHGTGFADAVIAATAQVERYRLVTLNDKHFPMLNDVFVPYVKS